LVWDAYEYAVAHFRREKKGTVTNVMSGMESKNPMHVASTPAPFRNENPGLPRKEMPDVSPETKETATTHGFAFRPNGARWPPPVRRWGERHPRQSTMSGRGVDLIGV
jgi:hypothetical protein